MIDAALVFSFLGQLLTKHAMPDTLNFYEIAAVFSYRLNFIGAHSVALLCVVVVPLYVPAWPPLPYTAPLVDEVDVVGLDIGKLSVVEPAFAVLITMLLPPKGRTFPLGLDHRHQRLLDHLARFREAGEVGSGPELRDRQVERAEPGTLCKACWPAALKKLGAATMGPAFREVFAPISHSVDALIRCRGF